MIQRAQTFPLNVNNLVTEERSEAWTVAEIRPYPRPEEKRVCFPNLEPWQPRDGQRKLAAELEATIKDPKVREKLQISTKKLRDKWSIKFEEAYRRTEGSNAATVPTVMVVVWDENGREYSVEDEELWAQACKEIVACLRDSSAGYFGVEIIYWDRLDYQVVT